MRHVTQPLFTLYALELGATILEIGLILSVQSVLMIFSRIPLTLLAEKIGENRMLLVTYVVQATVPVLYFLAPNPSWLYFIPLVHIVSTGSFQQLSMSMASNMAPSDRQGDALGRYMTILTMGMFIGPAITSTLILYVNYRQLYLVAALFPSIGFLIIQGYLKQRTASFTTEREASRSFESLRTVMFNRNIVILTIIRTSYSMSNSMFTALFALYGVKELGFSPSLVALLFSFLGVANSFIKFPVGKISDRVGRRLVLLIIFTLIIIDYIAIAYLKNFILVGIALIIFGACWGARAVTEWSLLANTVPPEIKAMAMSYLSSFWGVGATIGSIIAGITAETLPFQTIFIIMAIINIPALPSIHLLQTKNITKNSSK
jgi:MFS family permease